MVGLFYLLAIVVTVSNAYTSSSSNVCGTWSGMTVCCNGWTKSLDGQCTTAICAGNCGDRGRCVAPNQCRCEDNQIKEDCTVEDGHGYVADEPIRCRDNCNGQGDCIDGKCVCEYGYTGESCEVEETGPCFVQISRGLCQNGLVGYDGRVSNITRNTCCGSVGAAWGNMCKVCGSRSTRCGKGYRSLGYKCIDINECDIPGVCKGGVCRNTEGSYDCTCQFGNIYDAAKLTCVLTNDGCRNAANACRPGGRCIPLPGGSFRCQCNAGYQATDGNTRCQKSEVQVLNYCEIFEGRLCKYGVCQPTPNNYECTCNPGYSPTRNKKQCIKNIDACALYGSNVCRHGQCVPQGRWFRCNCDPGYSPSRAGTECMDKCQQLGSSVCQHGYCVTRPYGDYECQCQHGYEQSSDRKSCLVKANRYSYRKKESWGGSGYRGSYQADFPQDSKQQFRGHTYDSWPNAPKKPSAYPNPCQQASAIRSCQGGFCVNMGRGQYECQCFGSYRAVNANQRCVYDSRRQTRFLWPMRG